MSFKVLIPQDVAEEGKQYLIERGYEINLGSGITEEILKREIADCDAVLARTENYSADTIQAGKNVKVIARHGVGIDNIDVETATKLGIYVTTTPLANANSVAEHALCFMLALAKNLLIVDQENKNGHFDIRNRIAGVDLEGKTLGILGLGRIGSLLAKKARNGFDMHVIAYDPFVPADRVAPGIQLTQDWAYLFSNSDFISLHLPSTPETVKLVGKKEFELMKPTAYLINASRGDVLNEQELIEALQQGQMAGAGLDVFEQEPPSKDNPLFHMNNVVTTPHNAALTKEGRTRMALHAAISIDEVLSGKKPSWPVNNPQRS